MQSPPRKMGPPHPALPHDADEDEWPIGIRPDGTLNVVTEDEDGEEDVGDEDTGTTNDTPNHSGGS